MPQPRMPATILRRNQHSRRKRTIRKLKASPTSSSPGDSASIAWVPGFKTCVALRESSIGESPFENFAAAGFADGQPGRQKIPATAPVMATDDAIWAMEMMFFQTCDPMPFSGTTIESPGLMRTFNALPVRRLPA